MKRGTHRREPRRFRWTDGHKSGFVKAYSRSEARALVKLELGISRRKRVPIGISITEVIVEDTHATS